MTGASNGEIKRVLVLSGGGGRGAYQVGVCQYLENADPPWRPDMVLANSIGATNGAMLIAPRGERSGARLLDRVWRTEMLSDRIQEVSGAWARPLHEIMRLALGILLRLQRPSACRPAHAALRSRLARPVTAGPPAREARGGLGPMGGLVGKVKEWIGKLRRWFETRLEAFLEQLKSSTEKLLGELAIMERTGWRDVLVRHVDFDRLNGPDGPYFGVAVTDVSTGALRMFWNRVPGGVQGTRSRITVDHLMASSSIPGVYASTSVDGRYYWDGALAANAPIAPAIAVGATDIVVVLMTPWVERPEGADVPAEDDAPTVLHALERFMDWMMLSSFRREWSQLSEEQKRRITIVAPGEFQGLVSIIDYDEKDNATLIACGMKDAEEALG
jgi:NTE family protein